MKKKRNWLFIIGYPTSILFLGMTLLLSWWSVYPYKTIEVSNVNLVTKHVKRGGHLQYSLNWCKHTEKEAILSRKFEDGLIYHVATTISNVDKGCVEDRVISVYVPRALPPGKYALNVILTYQVNPIRKESVQYRTPEFLVTN